MTAPGTARTRPPQRRNPQQRRGATALGVGAGCLTLLAAVAVVVVLAIALFRVAVSGPGTLNGPSIGPVGQPAPAKWRGDQPQYGVDISFPQCGRTFRDMGAGFAIIGLDGGMPQRPNPCFASQWEFARRQAGVAVYVNTADPGRGDPAKLGARYGRDDVAAMKAAGVPVGTPVWLDVELPESWNGSQARHREVITAHAQALADAGYPVGVYSAPALWREITGDADPAMPVWVGLGRTTEPRARAACDRIAYGGAKPDIVQRIGTASDGKSLDRNLVCPGTDLAGLIAPTSP